MPSTVSSPTPPRSSLFEPGRNCWRVEKAGRFRTLVDGAEYFTALRQAIVSAQRSVFILGWDIDSRMRLVPGGADDGFPEPLAEFLHAIVAARRHLRVYVLSWDFAMLYAFEREWLPVFKMGWRAHRRFVFRQDGRHPLGGSHHQKMVVVDDALAFVGGLDLTRSRWDDAAHAADNPLRKDADGKPYAPFHDVQVMFDGPAAAAIGDLARERWVRAIGKRVAQRSRHDDRALDPWPVAFEPDVTDVELAICRTEPEYAGRPAVQEIRQMYLDGIRRAREHVYCENQYFTSGIVAEALVEKLDDPQGPEIVILSRFSEGGWLQEATMGTLRARLHRRLRAVDTDSRYRLYCPHVPELGDACVNVHSKLMIADDSLYFVGSANLNNRSMVLDTECNVALDGSTDPRVAAAIGATRDRLLAEHLGVEPATVAATLAQTHSLVATIEALRGQPRTMVPHDPTVTPDVDALVPDEAIIDPEQPVAPEALITQFVPEEKHKPLTSRFAGLGLLALIAAMGALLWRFTPLSEYLSIAKMVTLAQHVADMPFSPVVIVVVYVLAGLVSMPVTLLIVATGMAFGALEGASYAIGGTLASALVTYLAGRWLGRDTVRRLAGSRINDLSDRVADRGLVAMVVLRLLPVAPFTLVNVIAGASQIRLRDYLLGTVIGMVPGIVATVAFAQQLVNVIRHPTPAAFALLLAIAALLIGLSVALQRVFKRRERRHALAQEAQDGKGGTLQAHGGETADAADQRAAAATSRRNSDSGWLPASSSTAVPARAHGDEATAHGRRVPDASQDALRRASEGDEARGTIKARVGGTLSPAATAPTEDHAASPLAQGQSDQRVDERASHTGQPAREPGQRAHPAGGAASSRASRPNASGTAGTAGTAGTSGTSATSTTPATAGRRAGEASAPDARSSTAGQRAGNAGERR
ncbi:Phosphatidylserine/phosphatidylglycerophosphate/cardiolipin synthase [Chitinasiproducens palmae]|uniref:Phosphatidylserine/phosphatidylglycerophosphate/cardiolipin synthase n=1 Tax=Chitinasiproducens palmae TaxID=1770053 RepID=A0A1H2PM34_9BURK|nr:VTT domain-containing protein [Chitinasiproducens palmae]SDV47582.1 Phosphatidylserine/phosphatidylglycerophosphate/cardiolipin synthase [Chitinasiproducens palmae]